MSFTDMTIQKRIIRRPANGALDRYEVDLELSNSAPGSGGGGGNEGGGDPDKFPLPPASPTHWYSGSFTYGVISSGLGGQGIASMETGFSSPPETTISSTNTAGAVFESDTTYTYHIQTSGLIDRPPGYDDYGIRFGVAIHAGAPVNVGGTFAIWAIGDYDGDGGELTLDGTFTTGTVSGDVRHFSVSTAKSGPSEDHEITVSWWIDPDGWDTGAADAPPAAGQWVNGEIPTPPTDNATTTFYTRWPFADHSLEVTADGLSSPVSDYDGAAGTFTLPWTPQTGTTLVVRYQGR